MTIKLIFVENNKIEILFSNSIFRYSKDHLQNSFCLQETRKKVEINKYTIKVYRVQ